MFIYIIYIYMCTFKTTCRTRRCENSFPSSKSFARNGPLLTLSQSHPLWTSKVKSTMIPTAMRMKTMLIHPRGQSLRERVPMLPWLELNRPRLWIPWARPMLCSKAWASMWWWRRIRRRSCMTSSSRSMIWRSDSSQTGFFKNIWKDRG